MKFKYEGFDARANIKRGEIEANNEAEACQKLREQGIFAQQCVPGEETMRQVLPGGPPLGDDQDLGDEPGQPPLADDPVENQAPEPAPARPADPAVRAPRRIQAAQDIQDTHAPQGDLPPRAAPVLDKPWKVNLLQELDTIKEVYDFMPQLRGQFQGLPGKEAQAAYFDAFRELIKNAILVAANDIRSQKREAMYAARLAEAKQKQELESSKEKISREFVGTDGIHAVGMHQQKKVVRIYLDKGHNLEPALQNRIRDAAAPFGVEFVVEGAPRLCPGGEEKDA